MSKRYTVIFALLSLVLCTRPADMCRKKITIIGTGYVGLILGACLASKDNQVINVDIDEKKISQLQRGIIPIFEKDLESLVRSCQQKQTLHFSTNLVSALEESNIIFIAVGTPDAPDGSVNCSYLYHAIEEVIRNINHEAIICIKSTIPLHALDHVYQLCNACNYHLEVVVNPEFLREGCALEDFMHPDRVVIGGRVQSAIEAIRDLYLPFVDENTPIVCTDPLSAILIKYGSNGFLATKISFINELMRLCHKTGANIKEVAYGIGLDHRIGLAHLKPGPGFGGSCFPKDCEGLKKIFEENGVAEHIISATLLANSTQKHWIVQRIKNKLKNGGKVTILGLAFKPDTDDVRHSPSLVVINELQNEGINIVVYDPHAMKNMSAIFPAITYAASAAEACANADLVVVMYDCKEFNDAIECLKMKGDQRLFIAYNL
jgi:UDPglucose 6-dehydrogenase